MTDHDEIQRVAGAQGAQGARSHGHSTGGAVRAKAAKGDNPLLDEERWREVVHKVVVCTGLFTTSLQLGSVLMEAHPRFHSLKPNDKHFVATKLNKALHGVLVGGMAVYHLLVRRVWARDIFLPYPKLLDWQFSLTCAASIVDMCTFALRGERLSLWIHHIVECYGTALMMMYRYMPFFPAAMSVTLLTDPITALVMCLGRLGVQGAVLRKALVARAVAFVVLRAFTGPLLVLHALRTHSAQTLGKELTTMPRAVALGSAFNMAFLSVMNLVWTRQAIARLAHK